ncbi:hypothetical protein Pint_28550 [Pistacia integerrima]|uniref:Uncharacterized protein n=2 Tax=Pistacia integerrima TaxID=434235 RepID=A0ACC0YVG0_9ROSI|nr:hypothetical protein Pint_28561 [Pistacia integerrima]KAJ0041522.1 hypothetical protein Pint_28550 [Pistacia integerrima]
MAFAHYLVSVPSAASKHAKTPIMPFSTSSPSSVAKFSLTFSSSSLRSKARKLCIRRFRRIVPKAEAKSPEPEVSSGTDAFTHFKHLLLPITDRNPYLSEGTRQAAATTAALAKKYGADITVVDHSKCEISGKIELIFFAVIDEKQRESLPEHESQLTSIRWHLSEGGFQEFRLLERLGEGNKPTAIIGEVADDLNLDLVVISMEAIHSKHVDANLLAEFIPCPVLLLPL